MKLFFCDLETTGVDHKLNGIWQLGYQIVIDGERVWMERDAWLGPVEVTVPPGEALVEEAKHGSAASRARIHREYGLFLTRSDKAAALATLAVPPEPGAAEQPVEIDDREFDRE